MIKIEQIQIDIYLINSKIDSQILGVSSRKLWQTYKQLKIKIQVLFPNSFSTAHLTIFNQFIVNSRCFGQFLEYIQSLIYYIYNFLSKIFIVERYKHAFKEGSEAQNKDQQGLLKANEYLRECLRDLNYYIGKKVEKQREQIYQKFTSQSASGSLPKRSEEQMKEQQQLLLEKEFKNNSFILIQQEKEMKGLDTKLSGMHVNQQFELMQQIESLQDQIKKERLEIKQNRQFNFLEGKYLDNIVNNNQLPKVVEIQQSKQLDFLKMQNANSKLKEQISKKQELINEYNKKIGSIEKDYKETLQKEKQFKVVNQELLSKIKVQRRKVQQLEDNIELINHNIEREQLRYDNIFKDLKTLILHTDEKINNIEMQTRQINSDSQQLRSLGKEISPTFISRFPSEENQMPNDNDIGFQNAIENNREKSKGSKHVSPNKYENIPQQKKSAANLKRPEKVVSNSNLNKIKKNEQRSNEDFDDLLNPPSQQSKQNYNESKPNFSQKKIPKYIGQPEEVDDDSKKQISNKSESQQQLSQVEQQNQKDNDVEVDEDNYDQQQYKESKPQQTPQKQAKKSEQDFDSDDLFGDSKSNQKQTKKQQHKNEQQVQVQKQNSNDLDDLLADKPKVQQEKQKQQQQIDQKKQQKVDSGMQYDHNSNSNKKDNEDDDQKRIHTDELQKEITEFKNSSKEQKADNIKNIQQSINEIQNNINKMEQQSKNGSVKNKQSKNYLDLTPESNKEENKKQTKQGEDEIDLDEDLDNIEEEIKRLEEEMKLKEQKEKEAAAAKEAQQQQQQQYQQQQQQKTEIAPIKKPVAKKETSFTQTDVADDNNNDIFHYKNKESLSNIKEVTEQKQENQKSNNNINNNKKPSQNQMSQPSIQPQDQNNQQQKKSIPNLQPIKQSQQSGQQQNIQQKSRIDYNDLNLDDSADLMDDKNNNTNKNVNLQKPNNLHQDQQQQVNNNGQKQSIQKPSNQKNDESFDLDLLEDTKVQQQKQQKNQSQFQQQSQQNTTNKQSNNQQNNKQSNKKVDDLDFEDFD